jgi:lipopolysaccharide/colanic/teichoic acid biosynthesis glycosyltransferase
MNAFLKRAFDVLISLSVLIALSPLVLAMALAVKLTSRGPVFFKDLRAGKDGRVFPMLKFRTMVDGAVELGMGRVVAQDDWRITKVGGFLRRWTFDEIPQVLNVLAGDMSVVGPRAATPDQMARCTPEQRRRLEVRPGMAGWAWIHGRNTLPWAKRIELDVWYVDNWTFWLDMKILAKAFAIVLKKTGIYGPDGVTTDIAVSADPAPSVIDLTDAAEKALPVRSAEKASATR